MSLFADELRERVVGLGLERERGSLRAEREEETRRRGDVVEAEMEMALVVVMATHLLTTMFC